jgi:hypothetical protein
MLLPNGDGTYFTGPRDVALILQDVGTLRFHVCLLEEYPMPGPETVAAVVRLKSKAHNTVGSDTLEGATQQLDEILRKVNFLDRNILRGAILPWDGGPMVLVVGDWTARADGTICDVMPGETPRVAA